MTNYKKYLLLMSFVFIAFGFSSCTNSLLFDPNELIKANSQVKAFLNEYPNAQIQVTYFTKNESFVLNDEFKINCQKDLTNKNIYKFTVEDEETSFKMVGYLDADAQNIECLKKFSSYNSVQNEKLNEKEEMKKDISYYENKSNTLDSFKIKLKAEVEDDGKIKLEWHINNNQNIRYFKVVKSYDNPNPKYPEDGYIKVVGSSQDKEDYKYSYYEENSGIVYLRITTVFNDDSKVHSNVEKLYLDITHLKPKNDDYELKLKLKEGNILKWEVDTNKNIRYFKVVGSDNNPNPKYPEDGYLKVVSADREDKEYTYKITDTDNKYFRITLVTKDNEKIHSNIVILDNENILIEENLEQEQQILKEELETQIDIVYSSNESEDLNQTELNVSEDINLSINQTTSVNLTNTTTNLTNSSMN